MIAIVLIILFAAVCVRGSLRHGVLIFIASLPLYLLRFDIGPLPTTVLEALFGVLVIRWLWELRRSEARRVLRDAARRPIVVLAVVGGLLVAVGGLIGLSQSADIISSLGVWKSYLLEPLLFLFVAITAFPRDAMRRSAVIDILTALSFPVAFIGLVALFQFVTRLGIPAEWFLERRITSIFPYPNAVAHFTTPVAVAAIVALSHRATRARMTRSVKWLFAVAAVLGLTATALAQSEAALIAAAAVLVALALRHARTHSPRRFIVAFALVALGVGTVLLSPVRTIVVEKLTLQDWSGQTRRAVWQETAALLTHNARTFALGVGPNNYPAAIAPFHTHDYLETFQYPHNVVLNIWVEAGLIGLVGFLVLVTVCIRQRSSPHALVPLAALSVMLVHGLVDVPYFKNDLAFLTWMFLALVIMACAESQRLTRHPHTS